MFFLVKRKKDSSKHVARLNTDSQLFIVNNKDAFNNKKFHKLFFIARKLTPEAYDFLLVEYRDNKSMQKDRASHKYYSNPKTGFKVILKDGDPRIKEWGY